ncbi:hypothetical protein BR93DRAFT_541302 [Coniochaeta sp. PMI_546]|nr:hypothetical protein BR93DRAFT_541302 [Coniochaeta sp. PMI_546]
MEFRNSHSLFFLRIAAHASPVYAQGRLDHSRTDCPTEPAPRFCCSSVSRQFGAGALKPVGTHVSSRFSPSHVYLFGLCGGPIEWLLGGRRISCPSHIQLPTLKS